MYLRVPVDGGKVGDMGTSYPEVCGGTNDCVCVNEGRRREGGGGICIGGMVGEVAGV